MHDAVRVRFGDRLTGLEHVSDRVGEGQRAPVGDPLGQIVERFARSDGVPRQSISGRQPLGICAGITPFNFPAMVPMWMYPVAIACGNCFVLKPSERDPSTPLFLAELFREAGGPVPVVEAKTNKFVGLISDESLLAALENGA